MATKKKAREYRFKIDAYSPETMPLGRLAEYLHDLATLFGEGQSLHLIKVEGGSTTPVILVEWEAEPKIRERLVAIRRKQAEPALMRVAKEIDRKLRKDNATAAIVDPVQSKILVFAGREQKQRLEYGPFNQSGSLDGIPIRVGGEREWVPLHLERGYEKNICWVRRSLAKKIAGYLFTSVIRVHGMGRWLRQADGDWEMVHFIARDFTPLNDAKLREQIERMREVPADWKDLEDPLGELNRIRNGPSVQ